MKTRATALMTILSVLAIAAMFVPGLATADKKKKKCPISGKDAKDGISLNVNGKETGFCCNGCVKGYLTKYKVDAKKTNEKCPLSKKPVDAEKSLIHLTAKKVAFCCGKCKTNYANKNKLKMVDKGVKGQKCPLSGKPVKEDQKLVVNGETKYFCCGGCVKGYALKTLGIAKVKDESKKCPFSKKGTDPDTAILVVTGKKVGFCCGGCQTAYVKKHIKVEKKKKKKKEA